MSRAGETTIHTECTCSTHTAMTTRIWRRSSLTLPPSALSLMDWNPPVTTWTITLPHGRLRSGQSSTPALQTPGYRSGGATVSPSLRFVTGVRLHPAAEARNTQEMTNLFFFMNLASYMFVLWMCVYGGEFNWVITDGKMGCEPKKEIKECLFFSNYFLFRWERWNHAVSLLRADIGTLQWGDMRPTLSRC